MTFRSSNGAAALALAEAGHPVLPLHHPVGGGCSCGQRSCSRPGKHPRGLLHGIKSASTSPQQVEFWWFGQPEANIAMRTDGLVVVDVDGPEGRRSLERLQEDLAPLPETRSQASGRGRHHLYSVPAGSAIGNSTVPLGSPKGLDLRAGSGAYIVAAPSLHASGRAYRWLDPEAPIEPLPEPWIERLLAPKPVELGVAAIADSNSTAYGRAALRREMALLSRVESGNRNNALNKSVYKLAGWVSAGELDWYELHSTAREVGLELGLPFDEVERTICSAMNAGYALPRRKLPPRGRG